jgi:hypothetical protein
MFDTFQFNFEPAKIEYAWPTKDTITLSKEVTDADQFYGQEDGITYFWVTLNNVNGRVRKVFN